jgi:hypothetical protein
MEKSGADKAGSTANVESKARRLMPKEETIGFMFGSSRRITKGLIV